jgi:hypothetical protein
MTSGLEKYELSCESGGAYVSQMHVSTWRLEPSVGDGVNSTVDTTPPGFAHGLHTTHALVTAGQTLTRLQLLSLSSVPCSTGLFEHPFPLFPFPPLLCLILCLSSLLRGPKRDSQKWIVWGLDRLHNGLSTAYSIGNGHGRQDPSPSPSLGLPLRIRLSNSRPL